MERATVEPILKQLVDDPMPGISRLARYYLDQLKEGDRVPRGAP